MFRLVSIIILSAVLLAGCAGAGEWGTQMGILPKSSLPIIGGGKDIIGNKIVHLKGGGEVKGMVWIDTTSDTYYVFGIKYDHDNRHWKEANTIPKDQVSYMEYNSEKYDDVGRAW